MTTKTDKKMHEIIEYINEVNIKDHPESYLIAVLHKAQQLYGYLDRNVMDEVAVRMNIPTSHIWGVATFYHYFNLKPLGKHSIFICLGTACFVKGADKILDAIKDHLKVEVGGTTDDGLFSLRETRCLGACGLAPVIMIDERIYGELTPKKAIEVLNKYKRSDKKQ